jgi:hypothetical protein
MAEAVLSEIKGPALSGAYSGEDGLLAKFPAGAVGGASISRRLPTLMRRSEPSSIALSTSALLRPLVAQNSSIEYVTRVKGRMRFSRGRRGLGSIWRFSRRTDGLAMSPLDAVLCFFVRQQLQKDMAFLCIGRLGQQIPIKPDVLSVDKLFHVASPLRQLPIPILSLMRRETPYPSEAAGGRRSKGRRRAGT